MAGEHEHTLNVWLAGELRKRGLNAKPEVMHAGNRRIDIEARIGPVVVAVEAEHGQNTAKRAEAIKDADNRLRQKLAQCVVALCYPDDTTRESLPNARLIWTVRAGVDDIADWVDGDIDRLASVIRLAPAQLGEPDAAAASLSAALDEAVNNLSAEQKQLMARALDLPPSKIGRGSRSRGGRWDKAAKRAMLVIATAVMFHSRLDSHLHALRPEYDNRIPGGAAPFTGDWPPRMARVCSRAADPVAAFLDAWDLILALDYKPIFETATAALLSCPTDIAFSHALRETANAALEVAQNIASMRHDLLGRIFHTVLDTARYDGSFYTTTAAATLLATLAITEDMCDWNDADAIANLRITDPACGTGTLLMAAAERIHDLAPQSRDDGDVARSLIEQVFSGYDVNLTATHMAATTLGLLSPTTRFQSMKIGRAFLGVDEQGDAYLGSLEFLDQQPKMMAWPNAAQPVSQIDSGDRMTSADPADLVIMNPPFTQHDLRYQQFDKDEKWLIRDREKQLFTNKPVHLSSIGNAFIVLADFIRKADKGAIAAILPLATATHTTSREIRRFLGRNYHVETIVTSHDPQRIYFSENTSIGEMLLICRRWNGAADAKPPTQVINLAQNPDTPAMAYTVAYAILNGTAQNSGYGTVQHVPAQQITEGNWGAVQFFSPHLHYEFTKLTVGDVLAVRPFENIAEMGPANIRLAIDRVSLPVAGGMVALWDHKTDVMQSLSAQVDSHAAPKPGRERQAQTHWAKRGVLMLPSRVRLNTARTLSVCVNTPAMSSAWVPCRPNKLKIETGLLEKSLCVYFNSSIGVLTMLGFRSNKIPSYPQFSLDNLRKLIVPDFAAIGESAVRRLALVYDALCERVLLPLPQMDNDPVRRELDAAVCAALDIDPERVATIRRHLAAEPSITGKRYDGLG